jgi:hypothetical protein
MASPSRSFLNTTPKPEAFGCRRDLYCRCSAQVQEVPVGAALLPEYRMWPPLAPKDGHSAIARSLPGPAREYASQERRPRAPLQAWQMR